MRTCKKARSAVVELQCRDIRIFVAVGKLLHFLSVINHPHGHSASLTGTDYLR